MIKKSFLILLLLIPAVMAQSCITSSEDFATEVVLSDYTLFNLNKIAESSGKYVFPAEFDSRILTIIQETQFPKGLSVRIQIPTSSAKIVEPNLKIVSTSTKGGVKDLRINNFGLWQVSCNENLCTFEKENQKITAQKNNPEVTVEIRKELESCTSTCSGICLSTTSESKCIDSRTKSDFNTVLNAFNISDNFEDLLDSYRIVGSEEIILTDIQPELSPYINWQEALKQELVFLDEKEVVHLTREEIETISSLAKRGQAGQNYRIVKDYEKNSWNYYDKTEGAVLTTIRDCTEYSQIEKKETSSIELPKIDIFYLIPAIMAVSGVLLLLILVFVSRILSPKKEKTFSKENELK